MLIATTSDLHVKTSLSVIVIIDIEQNDGSHKVILIPDHSHILQQVLWAAQKKSLVCSFHTCAAFDSPVSSLAVLPSTRQSRIGKQSSFSSILVISRWSTST